jgi:hypothetical protein
MLAPTLFVAPTAHAEEMLPVWQVFCSANHFAADDPIVFPGQSGASHMHSFYGNTTTNANTTVNTLLASRSSCGREMQDTDHSAYWVPSLLNNGQRIGGEQTVFVYYQKAGGKNGPAVKPLPTGLRMIAGSMASTASNPNPDYATSWSCGGGGGGPHYNHIPLCGSLGPLHASIDFPNCWDGKHLDSADHKSHMAYSSSTGACPAAHPVSLPQVHFDLDYPSNKGGSSYTLSSGGQYSMHGDFFNAWDVQVQNALVSECLNANRDCSDITRSGNTLYKPAGDSNPVPRIDITKYPKTQNYQIENTPTPSTSKTPAPTTDPHAGHVQGSHTTSPTPTATPSPVPGSTLPETGVASVVGGALAVAALGYGFYEYRFRRRSLLQALRRFGRPRK